MDFISGLRKEKNKMHRWSEEEVYQSCVDAAYEGIKHHIHEKASLNQGNIVEGEVCVDGIGRIHLNGSYDFMEKKESNLYCVSYNPYSSDTLGLASLCNFHYKSSLFSKQVKASLTVVGNRALPDLSKKANKDCFQLDFYPKVYYPLYDGSGNDGSKNLPDFDVYEIVPQKVTRCLVFARYRIVL